MRHGDHSRAKGPINTSLGHRPSLRRHKDTLSAIGAIHGVGRGHALGFESTSWHGGRSGFQPLLWLPRYDTWADGPGWYGAAPLALGETFSGIRVVRAFRRELRELLDYAQGRHTVLRKELFANRREMVLWTSWELLLGIVNVVIVWYGGYLHLGGRASIGDIMAFQWYTFLLLNPVWNIVYSSKVRNCQGRPG